MLFHGHVFCGECANKISATTVHSPTPISLLSKAPIRAGNKRSGVTVDGEPSYQI